MPLFKPDPIRRLLWPWMLALVLLVQWGPVLFSNRTFFFRDLTFSAAPLLTETAGQWRQGVFPASTPNLACGAPLAADPNAQAFFPDMALLALIGPGLSALKLVMLLRLVLVPVAVYRAVRPLPMPAPACAVGAAFAAVAGPLATSLSSFPHHVAGAILFIPLAVAG